MALARGLFYFFLIFIPFGTRILIYQFTAGFHEYEAIFIYASDISLVLFLGSLAAYSNVFKNIGVNFMILKRQLFVFLTLAFLSIFFAASQGLAVYNFVRLALLVLTALAVAKVLREKILKIETIFAVIAGSAVFQSILGFLQFTRQSSLGLKWLGESVLGPDIGGAAKIVVDGVKILRAYGTFPHPNVLAAFLLLGLFSLYYLFLRSKPPSMFCLRKTEGSCEDPKFKFFNDIVLTVGIFVVLLGLTLTFSRTAWAIAILLTLLAIVYWLSISTHRKNVLFLLLTLLVSGYTLVAIFSPYVYTRATISQTEPAFTYRLIYNQMGLDIIKNNPLGIGIGNQVLHAAQRGIYQKFGMNQSWQLQPAHNIYLIIASELGVLGLATFLWFLLRLLIPNFKFLPLRGISRREIISKQFPKTNDQKLEKTTAIAMLSSLLLFGLFDHFLWTLEPGRLMLWLTIGLLLSHNTNQHVADMKGGSEWN